MEKLTQLLFVCIIKKGLAPTKSSTNNYVCHNPVMVLILDGNSAMNAHKRSNLCYLTCLKLLITSRAVTNRIFIDQKYLLSFMCAQHVLSYYLSYHEGYWPDIRKFYYPVYSYALPTLLLTTVKSERIMVLNLDGNTETGAHVSSNFCYLSW